jgi:hypothetical protein
MIARLTLLLAACGGTAQQLPPSSVAASRPAACVIDERDITAMPSFDLEVGGKSFMSVKGELQRATFEVTAGKPARARVETASFTLEGDVDLEHFDVRPRALALHDQWIEVSRASVRGVTNGIAELEVELAGKLTPNKAAFQLACSALAVSTRPGSRHRGEPALVARATPLALVPGGPAIATIDPTDPIEVAVLERKDRMARISLPGPNAVIGWVTEAALQPAPQRPADPEDNIYGGLLGGFTQTTCSRDLPLFVRTPAGEVRVGTLKANQPVELERTQPDPTLNLGEAMLDVYLHAADLAACTTKDTN